VAEVWFASPEAAEAAGFEPPAVRGSTADPAGSTSGSAGSTPDSAAIAAAGFRIHERETLVLSPSWDITNPHVRGAARLA